MYFLYSFDQLLDVFYSISELFLCESFFVFIIIKKEVFIDVYLCESY